MSLGASLWPGVVLATLGQPLTPDGALPGTSVSVAATQYVVSQEGPKYASRATTLANGGVITEFVNDSGTVFALSWSVPVLPPMDQLLGTYFAEFKALADASRTQRSLGTPLQIRTSTLVVESSGRMHQFSGYAYDPRLVPAGLQVRNLPL